MKAKIIVFFLLISSIAFSQPNMVSLVCVGEGATKNEALSNALRYAVEQTYGTFVSSQSIVINDELVSDETSSISTGQIVKYEELSSSENNGMTKVTVNATVSVNELINYAKNKGEECELAGNVFGANYRLFQFNKENEQKAFENLCKELNSLRPFYDYSLDVSNPVAAKDNNGFAMVKMSVKVFAKEKARYFYDVFKRTLIAISNSRAEMESFINDGQKVYGYLLFDSDEGKYSIRRPDITKDKKVESLEFRVQPPLYFYNKLPQKLVDILFDSIADYEISDNLGGRFLIPIRYLPEGVHNLINDYVSRPTRVDYDEVGNYHFYDVEFSDKKNIIYFSNESNWRGDFDLDKSVDRLYYRRFSNPTVSEFPEWYLREVGKVEPFVGYILLFLGTPQDHLVYTFHDKSFKVPISDINKISNIKITPKINREQTRIGEYSYRRLEGDPAPFYLKK